MIGPGPPMRRLPHRRSRFSSPKGTPLPFSLALKAATNQCGKITAAQMIRIHPSLPGRPTGSTMASTILVIDDDDKLNRLLKRFLKDYGFEIFSALDADEGLKKVRTVLPDLIILDIMLPGLTGFEVCKRIRESSAVPIIMLTARGM
jgi:PleD family two-component response regulator